MGRRTLKRAGDTPAQPLWLGLIVMLGPGCQPLGDDSVDVSDETDLTEAPLTDYPARALAVGARDFWNAALTDDGAWIQSETGLYQLVDGVLVPSYNPGLTGARRPVVRGPDGAPWQLDQGLRFSDGAWTAADPGFEAQGALAVGDSGDLVAVLVSNGVDDIHCEEDCVQPFPLHLWTPEGVVTVEAPVGWEVAARSALDWAVARDNTVRGPGGAQTLDGPISDLVVHDDALIAATSGGTLWSGPAGSMVEIGGPGDALVDLDSAGEALWAATSAGKVLRMSAGTWSEVPVSGGTGPELIVADAELAVGVASDCVYSGDAEGMAARICAIPEAATWVERVDGRIYSAGEGRITRWNFDGTRDEWPTAVVGLVSGGSGLQGLTESGRIVSVSDEGLETERPAELGDGIFSFQPLVRSSGGWTSRGIGDDGDFAWIAFDGATWTAGLLPPKVGGWVMALALASDGALWAQSTGGTHSLYRRAPGGTWEGVWSGSVGDPDDLVAVGTGVLIRTGEGLKIVGPTGAETLIGPQSFAPFVVDPLSDDVWVGESAWDGANWVSPTFDLPAAPTGFTGDGTPFVLAGDLWWGER